MSIAAVELQKAVFARLAADTALVAMLGGAHFFDLAPADAKFPYISFGASDIRDWSTDTEIGSEHVFTLHAWSKSTSRAELLSLVDQVDAALHEADLDLTGFAMIDLRRDSTEILFDEDLGAFSGRMRFRARVENL